MSDLMAKRLHVKGEHCLELQTLLCKLELFGDMNISDFLCS